MARSHRTVSGGNGDSKITASSSDTAAATQAMGTADSAHVSAMTPPLTSLAALARGLPADMATLPLDQYHAAMAADPTDTAATGSVHSTSAITLPLSSSTGDDSAINYAPQASIPDSGLLGSYGYRATATDVDAQAPCSVTSTSAEPFAVPAAVHAASASVVDDDRTQDTHTDATHDVPMPLITTDVSTQSSIRTGLKAYFSQCPRFCLAFVPAQEARFLQALDRWSGVLINSSGAGEQPWHHMHTGTTTLPIPLQACDALTLAQLASCIGWKIFSHDYSRPIHDGLLAAARDGLKQIMSRDLPQPATTATAIATTMTTTGAHLPNPCEPHRDWQQIVYCLQALLLGSTLEYGLDRGVRAGELLSRATDIVLALDLKQLVTYTPPTTTAMWPGSPALLEDLRRVYWELGVIQAMYTASTKGTLERCLLLDEQHPVASGSGMGTGSFQNRYPGSTEQEVNDYRMRVHAASLMLECVQPAPRGPSRVPRMLSLQQVLTNLAFEARHRFIMADTEQSLEMAYTACLMYSTARLQLIRLTFFPSWNYALKSCVFDVTSGVGNGSGSDDCGTAGPSSSSPSSSLCATCPGSSRRPQCVSLHWAKEDVRSAILGMVSAADDITDLVQRDAKSRWRTRPNESWESPHSPLLSHSPFHCCPHLVAAFGYRAAATLYGELANSAASPDYWWLRGQGEAVAAAAAAAATAGESHERRQERYDDAIWRHRAVLSNMSLAHAILVSINALWPIAGRFAREVDDCRRSVDDDSLLSVAPMATRGTEWAAGAPSSSDGLSASGSGASITGQIFKSEEVVGDSSANVGMGAGVVAGRPYYDGDAAAAAAAEVDATSLRNWLY